VGATVIVAMALSTVAPWGYTHAHENTECRDQGHVHPQGTLVAHSHCHRHCHATGNEPSTPAFLAPHTHQHVFWWGIEFVLPAPLNDAGDDGGDKQTAKIDAVESFVSQEMLAATCAPLALPPLTISAGESADVPQPPSIVAELRPEANLLCDAARRACSGVFLL
jgi:hypothetical protein